MNNILKQPLKEFFRKIMINESSKEFLIKNIKLKNEWNQSQINLIILNHIYKKPQTGKIEEVIDHVNSYEFSIEKVKIHDDSINNFKKQSLKRMNFKRFASTDKNLNKVSSNLAKLFTENLKGEKKIVNKTLHSLLNKNKIQPVNLEKKTKKMKLSSDATQNLSNVVKNQADYQKPLFKNEKRQEKINNFLNLTNSNHLKIKTLNKFRETNAKFVSFESFENIERNKMKLLLTSLTNPKIEFSATKISEKNPKFIILNGKNNCFQPDSDVTENQKKDKIKLFPLKYLSDEIYEKQKFRELWKKKKAFSFHNYCISLKN